ncbi:MAG: FkbM family methyltransferase [Gammaproteobacteria bacterium]|nr:FkbM family methyltransferase [Gammaproteobacteria bacterium]
MILFKNLVLLMKPIVEKFPQIAFIFRNTRDSLQTLESPKMTPWGFKMAGNKSMINGTFEPVETETVRNALKDVDVFVNIGANIGYYCLHALSMGKHVIAFEPINRNATLLYKNVKVNGWSDDIEIFPIALSNKTGILEIYGGDTGASVVKGWAGIPENYVNLVPVSTLDIVLGDRLKGKKVFILVDVEGAELSMLHGAQKLLKNIPDPVWMVEITFKENQPEILNVNPDFKETFNLFFINGYKSVSANSEGVEIKKKDIENYVNGKSVPPYYNYIFKK